MAGRRFTGNPELGAHLDLRARRVNAFYNGPILCKLLLFDIDPSRYTLAGTERSEDDDTAAASVSPGAQMFANRLIKNLRHLRRWVAREMIHAPRL